MIKNKFTVLLLACYFVQFSFCTEIELTKSKSTLLSRQKRYVAFPEGSSFSVAGCMTVGIIGQPSPTSAPGTFTLGLNWAIAYELPNATETALFYTAKKQKAMHQRRSRRDLYGKLESILNNMGYNGRQCILKTLCETSQRVMPHGSNMMEEIFRTLFTMPLTKLVSSEPLEHAIYDGAHRLGLLLENCDSMFACPISLVDWAQGYYNAPAPTADIARSPWTLFSSTFE